MKARCAVLEAIASSLMPKNGLPDWAAIVFVLGPDGMTPLVFDPTKKPAWWKFPGGKKSKKNKNETPAETAVRELYEETGLRVSVVDLHLVKEVDKSQHSNPHTLFVFMVCVDSFDGLLKRGDEGEIVRLFELKMIPAMTDFFREHWGHISKIYREALSH